jgi:hypothetical protein
MLPHAPAGGEGLPAALPAELAARACAAHHGLLGAGLRRAALRGAGTLPVHAACIGNLDMVAATPRRSSNSPQEQQLQQGCGQGLEGVRCTAT